MKELFDLVLGAVAEPAMHGLLHFLWQGGAVAMLLAGVLVLARPRRAETRYRLACGALVLMVILPVATAVEYGLRHRDHVPATLREAADLFAHSTIARSAFGDDVVDHYVNAARVELAAFDSAVTDWERFRGFERL